MPVIRQNPITKQWVIFAPERSQRPVDFAKKSESVNQRNEAVKCPFCLGHEAETPPEVAAFRLSDSKPDAPGWTIRVVPNKYPALKKAANETFTKNKDLEREISASGLHEVVIFSPKHHNYLETISAKNRLQLLLMLQQRIIEQSKIKQIKYIQIIGNFGREAGASLSHPHLQIFSLPLIPPALADEFKQAQKYYNENSYCVFCQMLKEMSLERIVWQDRNIICFEPFAPSTPFETWLMPKKHLSGFAQSSKQILESFGEGLKTALQKIIHVFNFPPYNFYLHTLPTQLKNFQKSFHWYLVIKPLVYKIAGFEMASGVYINNVLPEKAAEYLRKSK